MFFFRYSFSSQINSPRSGVAFAFLLIIVVLLCSASFRAQPTRLPQCKDLNKAKTAGERLILTVPGGSKVKARSDADYSAYFIKFKSGGKDYFLTGIFGPTATGGTVPKSLLEQTILTQKQWSFADPNASSDVTGTDTSGRHLNGNYWRYLGTPGEAVSYSDVPQEAAAFFDKILDSVCYKAW